MIFSNTSNYMLKYQKAKAKLVEYDIPQKDYPKFPLNSNELSYPVVYMMLIFCCLELRPTSFLMTSEVQKFYAPSILRE